MYGFDGNQEFEQLDKILKNTVVLHEDVKQRFYGIMLTVRQHGGAKKYGDEMMQASIELQKDLHSLTIFKEDFVNKLCGLLQFGIGAELALQSKK
jgi:hypothetical protein